MRFQDQVVVITGAAGILGMEAAKRFLAEGARVALIDNNASALDAMVQALAATDQVHAWVANVADPASVRQYAEGVATRFGPVDVFLNNAGIEGVVAPVTEYPDEVFAKVMAINVTGVFLGMKYVTPRMRDGGSVVITSSVASMTGSPGFVGYVASKHAVIGIARTSAVDLASRRIRVNTVHPSMVKSAMMERIEASMDVHGSTGGARSMFENLIPLGRYVTPAEVIDSMLYLAGPESRMVTGTQLVVDGGFTV